MVEPLPANLTCPLIDLNCLHRPFLISPDVLLMLSTSLLLLSFVVLTCCSHTPTLQSSPSTVKHAVIPAPFLVLPHLSHPHPPDPLLRP